MKQVVHTLLVFHPSSGEDTVNTEGSHLKRWLILSNQNKRTESVRTIEELSLEFVLQTFYSLFLFIYLFFLLKANKQFVEVLPTTYIFQFRSIYNIAGKVV